MLQALQTQPGPRDHHGQEERDRGHSGDLHVGRLQPHGQPVSGHAHQGPGGDGEKHHDADGQSQRAQDPGLGRRRNGLRATQDRNPLPADGVSLLL